MKKHEETDKTGAMKAVGAMTKKTFRFMRGVATKMKRKNC